MRICDGIILYADNISDEEYNYFLTIKYGCLDMV